MNYEQTKPSKQTRYFKDESKGFFVYKNCKILKNNLLVKKWVKSKGGSPIYFEREI